MDLDLDINNLYTYNMLYFAYGMNTNADGMRWRCPAAVAQGQACLPSWRFRFAGPADIVPDQEHQVFGVLWKITDQCLTSLDDLEGYPYFYTRDLVSVIWQGQTCPAMVYFMQPGHDDLEPSQVYLHTVRDGYRHFAVNQKQIDLALEKVQWHRA